MNLDKTLLKISDITHGRISRPQTFGDFVAFCALLLSARTDPVHTEERTNALKRLKKNYTNNEWQAFHQVLLDLCSTFVRNTETGLYEDLFAFTYTRIGAASKAFQQNFTPADIARLIGAISVRAELSLPEEGFFTMGDQACGSGTLLLGGAQRIANCGYNPTAHLAIQAADLDARCVHMAYLNLSLYGIPAVIVHGNTITLDEYDRWYTPAYLWGKWIWRAPMSFGESGYVSDEKLKCYDESVYAACRFIERQCSTADVNAAADKEKQNEK